jgi:hypothetical protein
MHDEYRRLLHLVEIPQAEVFGGYRQRRLNLAEHEIEIYPMVETILSERISIVM